MNEQEKAARIEALLQLHAKGVKALSMQLVEEGPVVAAIYFGLQTVLDDVSYPLGMREGLRVLELYVENTRRLLALKDHEDHPLLEEEAKARGKRIGDLIRAMLVSDEINPFDLEGCEHGEAPQVKRGEREVIVLAPMGHA
jgi:hypothetical protein